MNPYPSPWTGAFSNSLQYVAVQLGMFLPNFIAGIIVLALGLIIAWLVGQALRRILIFAGLNSASTRLGLSPMLDKYGTTLADAIAALVRWFFYIVTFIAVANIWQIPQLTAFLTGVAYYIPNVVVAVVILAVGFLLANFVRRLVDAALISTSLSEGVTRFISTASYYAILVFTILTALYQLGIASNLIEILFGGIVVMMALAGGLAFGLGGRDRARDLLEQSRGLTQRAKKAM